MRIYLKGLLFLQRLVVVLHTLFVKDTHGLLAHVQRKGEAVGVHVAGGIQAGVVVALGLVAHAAESAGPQPQLGPCLAVHGARIKLCVRYLDAAGASRIADFEMLDYVAEEMAAEMPAEMPV